MNEDSPRPGGLSRLSHGRVMMCHAPDCRPIQDRIDHNQGSRCVVPGCGGHRWKLSSTCRQHYRHWEGTGHPIAPSIRRGTWRPWVADAYSFVADQLQHDHAGIAAGVSWCAEELFGGSVLARRVDPKRPHTGHAFALAKLRGAGVGPDDLLARWVAAHAFQLWDAESPSRLRAFQSDSHFRHQAARLFLFPAPIAAPKWARAGNGDTDPDAITRDGSKAGPRVREYVFARTNAALGVLALRAAEELNRRLLKRSPTNGELPTAQRVDSDSAAFITTNT